MKASEQTASLISDLMELRKELREMVVANHNHFQTGTVVDFKHVDPVPFSREEIDAAKQLIAEAEMRVRLAVV